MKQLCKDVQQVLCLLMVLFKFLWLPRFVIELTQRWGCTVQITSEFPNRQTPEDSPPPLLNLNLTFTFYSWLKDHYKLAPSASWLPLGTEEISFISSCLGRGPCCAGGCSWNTKHLREMSSKTLMIRAKAGRLQTLQDRLLLSCQSLFLGLHTAHRTAVMFPTD